MLSRSLCAPDKVAHSNVSALRRLASSPALVFVPLIRTSKIENTMKLKIKEIPVIMEGPGTVMRRQAGLGNMDIGYIELPKGADFYSASQGAVQRQLLLPSLGVYFPGRFPDYL